jgi:CBS domain-containing protein
MSNVAELLTRQGEHGRVQTIAADSTVLLAAKKLRSQGIGCLLVVDPDGKLVGVLSERDIVSKVVAESADTNLVDVAQVMTADVISCCPDTPCQQAEKIMDENNIRHLPVVRYAKPIGMISTRDVLHHRLDQAEQVARHQHSLLKGLETQHPGITNIQKDASGRIVI